MTIGLLMYPRSMYSSSIVSDWRSMSALRLGAASSSGRFAGAPPCRPAGSTGLVLFQKPPFVADVYKCYLNCAYRIICENGGETTAFRDLVDHSISLGQFPFEVHHLARTSRCRFSVFSVIFEASSAGSRWTTMALRYIVGA